MMNRRFGTPHGGIVVRMEIELSKAEAMKLAQSIGRYWNRLRPAASGWSPERALDPAA